MVVGIQRQGGKAKIFRINPAGDTHLPLQTHAFLATGFFGFGRRQLSGFSQLAVIGFNKPAAFWCYQAC